MVLEVPEDCEEASSGGSPAGATLWIEGELCDGSLCHVSAQFPLDESVDGQGQVGQKQEGVDATNAMQRGGVASPAGSGIAPNGADGVSDSGYDAFSGER